MVSPVYIRPLLALLVMAAIIGIAAVVFRNGSHGSVQALPAAQQLPRNIDVTLKKARFSEIKDGHVAWELEAERVDYDKSGDTAFLTDIRMVFQGGRSQGAVTVSADSGTYQSNAKDVRLNGHVHIETADGASFKTASLLYTGDTEQFSTTAPVVFRQQGLQLTAVGMDVGVKDQQAHFYSSVDALVIRR